jgi:hypothetical protein
LENQPLPNVGQNLVGFFINLSIQGQFSVYHGFRGVRNPGMNIQDRFSMKTIDQLRFWPFINSPLFGVAVSYLSLDGIGGAWYNCSPQSFAFRLPGYCIVIDDVVLQRYSAGSH